MTARFPGLVLLCLVLLCLVLATSSARAGTTPEAAVDAFHAALRSGDAEGALALLAEDVVIFEGGGAEMSREEYRSHHLEADMAFSAATASEITDRASRPLGDGVMVLTRSRTTGTFRDREIDHAGAETMVLEPAGEGWKIAHIHWSSHRLAE